MRESEPFVHATAVGCCGLFQPAGTGRNEMIYAQIKHGHKLHLVYEAGEGRDDKHLVKAGYLSLPLCGQPAPEGYRMTINAPLSKACKRCLRVYKARAMQAAK